MSTPIRQPRGPTSSSTGSFGHSPSPSTSGPPQADTDALRRSNSVSHPRHGPSASISSTPAASSAFHGSAKFRVGAGSGSGAVGRFRSGSLSAGQDGGGGGGLVTSGGGGGGGGLVSAGGGGGLGRHRSLRESGGGMGKEEVLLEEGREEGGGWGTESGSWGKGLGRQSSLPSRKVVNPVLAAAQATMTPGNPSSNGNDMPPPRPPRRVSTNLSDSTSPPPIPSAHAASHSLSSLSTLNDHPSAFARSSPDGAGAAGVSRTQSLRSQAKHGESAHLGRSSSLRAAGEQSYYRGPVMQPMTTASASSALSPPSQTGTPRNPFTPPTPPPASSTAALPPFHLPMAHPGDTGADLKRHQSLTAGSSSRVRERLERTPALLSMDQREEMRRTAAERRKGFPSSEELPPTSPIGRSVWSPAAGQGIGDDGWAGRQMQDAFQAMQLGRSMMGQVQGDGNGAARSDEGTRVMINNQVFQQQQQQGHDEPSWVANLVGHSPQPAVRSASAPGWASDRDAVYSTQPGSMGPPPLPLHLQPQQQQQRWPDQNTNPLTPQQMAFLAQQGLLPPPSQHQQPAGSFVNLGGMKLGGPLNSGSPGPYTQPNFPGYLSAPFTPQPGQQHQMYPSPPATAPLGANDVDVINLARSKGLNPATFNCRPAKARFFVIKSYTEDDVQKSLKHEIWSSTVLGNKRLDTAFRESANEMPIYLFFSVNGSRHFCGVAQMLTPVDESRTSTVWAQDKWKGIFKVKWIFVRDVPSPALRHIRLLNTPEQKPITNSRDTQELLYDAGCEVLQIFLDHQSKSKTSLLQDFAYYEQLSTNRQMQPSPGPPSMPQVGQGMPMSAPPQHTAMFQIPPQPGMAGVPPVPTIPSRFR